MPCNCAALADAALHLLIVVQERVFHQPLIGPIPKQNGVKAGCAAESKQPYQVEVNVS